MVLPKPPLIQGDINITNGLINKLVISNNIEADTDLNMKNNNIINLATPTNDADAVTKSYVDTHISSSTTLDHLSLTNSGTNTLLSAGQVVVSNTENIDPYNFNENQGSFITKGGLRIEKDLFLNGSVFIPENTGDDKQNIINLIDGNATVFSTAVSWNSRIFLTIQQPNNPGFLYISTKSPGESFVISSSSITDTSSVAWIMTEGVYPICFHASSKVQLENGTLVRLDELRYSDRVLAFDSGNYVYSKVITFTGVFPTSLGSYVNLYYNNNNIILSDIHLIYSMSSASLKEEFKYIKASEAKIGDFMMSESGPVKITKIVNGYDKGWYTPLTEIGTIIVNGVVASCHTAVGNNGHDQARYLYKPLQFYYKLFPNKNTLPDHNEVGGSTQWYSIVFRRGILGKFISYLINK